MKKKSLSLLGWTWVYLILCMPISYHIKIMPWFHMADFAHVVHVAYGSDQTTLPIAQLNTAVVHKGIVSVSISPDGKRVLSADADGRITFHDAKSGDYLFEFKIQDSEILAAQWSIDGRMIVTLEKDRLLVREATTGRLLATYTKPGLTLYSMALSEGKVFCQSEALPRKVKYGNDANHITIPLLSWTLNSEELIRSKTPIKLDEPVTIKTDSDLDELTDLHPNYRISANGRWLVECIKVGWKSYIQVRDLRDMSIRRKIPTNLHGYSSLRFAWMNHPDQIAVLGDKSSYYYFYDLSKPDSVPTRTSLYDIRHLHMIDDDKKCIGVRKGKLGMYDISTGELIHEYASNFNSYLKCLDVRQIRSSHYEKEKVKTLVWAGLMNGHLQAWDEKKPDIFNRNPHLLPVIKAFCFPDEHKYLTIGTGNTAAIWDAATFELERVRQLNNNSLYESDLLNISKDHRWIGTIHDRQIKIWRSRDFLVGKKDPYKILPYNHAIKIAWSWDNAYLAIHQKGLISIYSTTDFKVVSQVDTNRIEPVYDYIWSRDGLSLYASYEGGVQEWCLDGPEQAHLKKDEIELSHRGRRYHWGYKGVPCLSVSPDGYMLAGHHGASVTVWEVHTGNKRFSHRLRKGEMTGLKWLENGRLGAGTLKGDFLRLDLLTGEVSAMTSRQIGKIHDLIMDESNQRILTIGNKNAIWNKVHVFGEFKPETYPINLYFDNEKLWGLVGGENVWQTLAGDNLKSSQISFKNIINLSTHDTDATLDWLSHHIEAMEFTLEKDIQPLIRELNNPNHSRRQNAFLQLRSLSSQAYPLIARTLEEKALSLEALLLLKELKVARHATNSSNTIRTARIIELIDRIHTSKARDLLINITRKPGLHPLKSMAERLLKQWDKSYYASLP